MAQIFGFPGRRVYNAGRSPRERKRTLDKHLWPEFCQRGGVMPKIGDTPCPSALQNLYGFLLTMSLMGLLASGQHLCQKESIGLLRSIIKCVGNSSDGTLFTPDNITVCYADNLSCFHLELQVIQQKQEKRMELLLSRLVTRLQQMKVKLQRGSWGHRCTTCQSCHYHPEQPMLVFLNRLLELLQWNCRTRTNLGRKYCPPPAP
ncbi:uncharacterized protein LOC133370439 [Rhineura floridana]|uniref:uncharacterized protein LOC133370439 n=1 Tax=Rhineura floridana TaxID=261503 RepID=UPI002AC845C9|nr:uncharacterized protein LOC133370439 [Rhineura floridana]